MSCSLLPDDPGRNSRDRRASRDIVDHNGTRPDHRAITNSDRPENRRSTAHDDILPQHGNCLDALTTTNGYSLTDMTARTDHGPRVDHNAQGMVREICVLTDAGSIRNVAGEHHAHSSADEVCGGRKMMAREPPGSRI